MENNTLMGILPVYKESGWTSFDVVAKLRGVLHIKRLGHGGTLDPMATGVLPVFVGKAAKCCDILPDKRKSYKAGFKLGITTDTQDITGKVLESSDMQVSREQLEARLSEMTGYIMQLPPMYSAVKVGGKKLYELAREGRTVERKPRQVHIERLTLSAFDETLREGELEIDCGQGTYVRTIIDDIGRQLGCGGAMTSLERTRSGGFETGDCYKIDEIAAHAAEGTLEKIMLPTDKAFAVYPECRLSDERVTAMYKNGVKLREGQFILGGESEQYRVYGADGGFLGLGTAKDGGFLSTKNFY